MTETMWIEQQSVVFTFIIIIQALLCFVSDELTRLWNLNHDNMEACKSDSRSVVQKAR